MRLNLLELNSPNWMNQVRKLDGKLNAWRSIRRKKAELGRGLIRKLLLKPQWEPGAISFP